MAKRAETSGAAGPVCPVCDEAAADAGATACARCNGALLLHQRFALRRLLGAGGQSRVYEADDRRDGGSVALKILSLARAREWKDVELFRRAAKVLAGIEHPSVPRVIDYFEEQRPGLALYCLAHELIDGETLAEAANRGERWDQAKAVAAARQVLEVLRALHDFSPPVIHRDLKPSNLMRRRSDGRLMLIDFDLVRDVVRPEGGSTIAAGTPGFAPPEQFVGEASPVTDLYALGVTLAVLLSRKQPLALRRRGEQRLEVRRHVNVSNGFGRILEKLVEPEPARRYGSAREVLEALDALDRPASTPAPPPKRARSSDDREGSSPRGLLGGLAVAVGMALFVWGAVAYHEPSWRPWIGHLDQPRGISDLRPIVDGDRPIELLIERVLAHEFASTEYGTRLSILDLSDGRTVSQRYLGKSTWTYLARGPGMAWLRTDDNRLQAIDLASGARLIDENGIVAANPSLRGRLLVGPGHGNAARPSFDPETRQLVLPLSDGTSVRIAPRTWQATPLSVKPTQRLFESEARDRLRTYDSVTIERERWQLAGADARKQLTRNGAVVSPDAATLLEASFLLADRRLMALPLSSPDGFLVRHRTALGAGGREAISRLGLDGKPVWTWVPPMSLNLRDGGERGGTIVRDALIIVAKLSSDSRRDQRLLVSVDLKTGAERWRRTWP